MTLKSFVLVAPSKPQGSDATLKRIEAEAGRLIALWRRTSPEAQRRFLEMIGARSSELVCE